MRPVALNPVVIIAAYSFICLSCSHIVSAQEVVTREQETRAINALLEASNSAEFYVREVLDNGCAEYGYQPHEILYTEAMRRLASFDSQALPMLVREVDNEMNSRESRLAAVQAIHLIGIQGIVHVGAVENFRNKESRDCLLGFLKYKDLRLEVLRMLVRDPWRSDVPALLHVLATEEKQEDFWGVVKALQRYDIASRPVHQPIPADFPHVSTRFSFKSTEEYFDKAFRALRNAATDRLRILDLTDPLFGLERVSQGFRNCSIRSLLEDLTGSRFARLGNRLEYYVDENGIVVICDCGVARSRWMQWNVEHSDLIQGQ